MSLFKSFFILFLLQHSVLAFEIGNVGFYSQVALPLGDLAAVEGPQAGSHKLGAGLGVEIDLPMFRTVNWLSTVSFSMHRYLESTYPGAIPIRMLDAFYFRHLSVLTGLKYQHEASDDLDLFYLVQVGMNRMSIPSFEGVSSSDGQLDKVRYTYNPSSHIGVAVGMGFYLNERFAMSLRYVNFGKNSSKGLIEVNDDRIWIDEVDMFETNVSMILMTFGVNFEFY